MNPDGLIAMHKLMSQFAQLALYSVAVISGTGIVLGLLRFSQLQQLATTSYGLILTAKIGAFFAGATHRRIPSRTGNAQTDRAFRIAGKRRSPLGEEAVLDAAP